MSIQGLLSEFHSRHSGLRPGLICVQTGRRLESGLRSTEELPRRVHESEDDDSGVRRVGGSFPVNRRTRTSREKVTEVWVSEGGSLIPCHSKCLIGHDFVSQLDQWQRLPKK